MAISGGYIGSLKFDGTTIRTDSFSVNLIQNPLFYDHTIGLRDNIPSGLFGGKGDAGERNNPQKSLYRPSVVSVTGGLSFILSDKNSNSFFKEAKTGNEFEMEYSYDCNTKRKFTGCRINTYTITATAGELIRVNADVMALDAIEETGHVPYRDVEKLITWDKFSINSGGFPLTFSMTISNNLQYIYTAKNNLDKSLRPLKIRAGIQEVKGMISFYNKGAELMDLTGKTQLSVETEGLSFTLNCIFNPITRDGNVGPYVSNWNFVGVGTYWI